MNHSSSLLSIKATPCPCSPSTRNKFIRTAFFYFYQQPREFKYPLLYIFSTHGINFWMQFCLFMCLRVRIPSFSSTSGVTTYGCCSRWLVFVRLYVKLHFNLEGIYSGPTRCIFLCRTDSSSYTCSF